MSRATALLVIDVQLGMFAEADPIWQGDDLLAKLNQLIGRARAAGVPVIYIQHDGGPNHPLEPGTPGWPIHPAVAPAVAAQIIAHHNTVLGDWFAALQLTDAIDFQAP